MPAGIYIKSCTLEAFWAVRLKPGKISENVKIVENHRNSNQIKAFWTARPKLGKVSESFKI